MSEKTSLERLQELNRDSQRMILVSAGVLKSARSEILAHVKVSGKGVMTDIVLNSLNAAINGG